VEAALACGTSEVVLLPNHRDVVPAAQAAAREAAEHGVRVAVVPTKAQVQGLAALAVHEPGIEFDPDVVAMTTAAAHVRTGAVTVAAREAMTSAGRCQVGDVLGVVERDFVVVTPPGPDALLTTGRAVLERMLSLGGELVTVVRGRDAPPDLAEALAAAASHDRPELDVVVLDGGQPRYPLLLGVE
jgi:dihydroxyacetone kinase-like predicted kinase